MTDAGREFGQKRLEVAGDADRGHVAGIRMMKNAQKLFVGKLQRKGPFERHAQMRGEY
jgi:hypothetical protein